MDVMRVESPACVMAGTAVFMERHLNHFRVDFYEGLRCALGESGVRLRLLVGNGTPQELSKHDVAHIEWAEHRPTQYLMNGKVAWMPYRVKLGRGDLIVVEQANKLVLNLWELLKPREYRFAFLGHGRNMQAHKTDSLGERFKQWTTNRADWYFAYTDISRSYLVQGGFPSARITVFNNAIDTRRLVQDRESISESESRALREQLKLPAQHVCMFLGSLYAQKGLDFGWQAARLLHSRIEDFHWLVVGDGPDRHKVDEMAAQHSWVHSVGARLGREKALYASVCDLLLIPSAVGLVALDSFALGKPIATTADNQHGPEISYLEPDQDSLVSACPVDEYANSVADLLLDRPRLAAMQARCLAKASTYTIEAMIENVRRGVLAAMA